MRNSFYIILSLLLAELLYTGCTSGKQVKNNHTGHNEFIAYCEQHLRTEPDMVCKKLDSVMRANHHQDSIPYLLMLKAKCKFVVSEYDWAAAILDTLYICANNMKDTGERNRILSDLYNTKGNIYARKTLSDSAIAYFKKAYKQSAASGASKNQINISLNLADAYVRNGMFDMGAYWYRKSLSISDTLLIPEKERFPSFYGLGQVYMELRDFQQCDLYYDKAGKYFDSMMPYEQHFYLNNRGNSYYFRGDYTTALEYFRRSQKLVNSRKEMEFERNLTMVNLGEIFILLNQTDSATYYLDKCYSFFKKINSVSALYYIETQLIELALKKNNAKEAGRIISQAVKPAYVEPNMQLIRNKYLQHYFEQTRDYKNAYLYQTKNVRMDDSIRNAKIKMRASEIGLRYKQDSILMKKEYSIKEKENELEILNQWIYMLILSIMLIVTASISYAIYKKRINDRKIWNLKTNVASMRLENIRNRISPHFIFNVINREMVKHSDDSEKNSLMQLSKLIRKSLELTDSQYITLKDELDFVDTYISIEKQKNEDELDYNLQIDKNIDASRVNIPSMFIQIPVENAIKHSLLINKGKKKIRVAIALDKEYIEITITDNGGGFNATSINKGTQTGLKVVTQSIQLLNLYNKQAMTMRVSNVKLENSETGCEIKYLIPTNFNYNIKK